MRLFRLAGLAPFLFACSAGAQIAGTTPLTISNVTTGNEVTVWSAEIDNTTDEPDRFNYVYTDVSVNNTWNVGDIFTGHINAFLVHTKNADNASTGSSTLSFDTDGRAQICVWSLDAITTKPSWLASSGYIDSGHDITLPGGTASGYCSTKAAGTITLGGNTSDGSSVNDMYVVSVVPAWRAAPSVDLPPPDENGFIVFADASGSMDESTTSTTLVKFRRILGSVGAVTVDVDDAGTGSCSVSDYTITYPEGDTPPSDATHSWADAELGNKFLTLQAGAISSTCTVVFDFSALTGGISAYTERQTMTVTVNDTDAVSAGDLFVEIGGSGSDTNDCTSGTPCLTLSKALSVAFPGDVIEIQVSGTGTGTYDQCTTINRSGSSGSPITIRARSGDTVNFYPSASCDAILDFDGASYVTVDGSVGTIVLGDSTEWTNADAGTGYTHSQAIRGINSANNIEISTITAYGGSLIGGDCNKIDRTTTFWNIHDSTFDLCGTNNDQAGLGNDGHDRGDLFQVDGSNHTIEDNTFSHGGHAAFAFGALSSVVRGNTFDGNWADKSTGYAGNRTADFEPGANRKSGVAPYGPNLIERNIFKNAGASVDNSANPILKLDGYRLIFRQNLLCTNDGAGIRINHNNGGYSVDHTVESMRVYNNTFIDSGGFVSLKGDRATSLENMSDMRFVNNLGDNFTVDDTWLIEWDNNVAAQQGYPNDWLGAEFDNNWLHSDNYSIRMTSTGGSTTKPWFTDAETEWPNNFTDNAKTRATYVDSTTCDFTNLALAGGSSGIGAADPLATVSSGSTGSVATVSDAWWAWNGDYVAFYDSTGTILRGVRSVTVNSQTEFGLSSSITLTAGDLVFPVESDGVTVVDNMGAAQ